tara:strand:+ start:22 stop:561 length:540 start_codon:yes stop_codon:yes gene_type:complete
MLKKYNLFLQDDKTQGKVSAVLLFIAWAYEIPDFEFAVLDKVMAFIGAVALSNVILLSYKLIEHKDLPSNWQNGIAMIAAIMLVAGLLEVGSPVEDPSLRVFFFFFLITVITYTAIADDVIPNGWRYATVIGAVLLMIALAEDIFVGTDNLSILWTGYLILTVAFPAGNYVAWNKYEAK